MSTATMTQTAKPAAASRYRVTFPNLLKSELIKLTTVRSTVWSLSVAFVLIVGMGALMAFASRSAEVTFGDDLVGAIAPVLGVAFAQLVFVVLSVISIGSEYATGMIRSTLTAAPTRIPALIAKMLIMWIVSFVVSLVAILVAFFLVQAILTNPDMRASLSDSDTLLTVVGGALYISVIAVFSMAVGAIVRNTAGGIAIVVGLLLVVSGVLSMIPWEWVKTIGRYLPDAGQSILYPGGYNGHSPWAGFAILAVWAVVTSAVACGLIKSRDA